MKIKKESILALLFFLMLIQGCKKDDEIDTGLIDEFETFIQNEMDVQKVPALSVLVFREEEILYENYFGRANLEENLSLTKDHIFILASVSKLVTASALLRLYDQNAFQLDDNINDYLPFEVKVPNQTTEISFRMLLTHTSGIKNNWNILDNQIYYGKDSPLSLGFFIENYLSPGGEFYSESDNFHDSEPNTMFDYSGIGTALIAILVEEISGVDFNAYCKNNIFNPLGMTNTYWHLEEITQAVVQPYDYSNNQYNVIQHYTFTDYPKGGLRSNGSDLFAFLSAFAQNGIFNNYQLLKPETIKEITTPQIPTIYDKIGLHIFLIDIEKQLWGHYGSSQGAATIIAFNPSTKIGLIILTNNGNTTLLDIYRKAYDLGIDLHDKKNT